MPQHQQPFLHDLVILLAAPTQALSAPDGSIEASEHRPTAQGVIHADVRVLSGVRVEVNSAPGVHLHTSRSGPEATFTSLLRHVGEGIVDVADPQVRLDQRRVIAPGRMTETLTISSRLPEAVALEVMVRLSSDLAAMEHIKVGAPVPPRHIGGDSAGESLSWGESSLTATVAAPGASVAVSPDGTNIEMRWTTTLPAADALVLPWSLSVVDSGGAVVAASTPPLDAAAIADHLSSGQGDSRLRPWLLRSLEDLNGLRMATVDLPGESFMAAGAPWYLTLFGRDSIWAARMLLPVNAEIAVSTLRTLARLQGTKVDPNAAEQPGKILHELRRGQYAFGDVSLPPLYFGTIDATPLWVCLLHDAWRAGMAAADVRALLPNLQAALRWLVTDADADGDGFLEYVDGTGHGLTNQGWKDSGDSVRFADGTIAEGAVALCEVQGYAYEAAMGGADLLEAFGLAGAGPLRDWATALASRFQAAFWCGSGADRYPALALDGAKAKVDALTSNIGHLLGTGILSAAEERLVARRLTAPDMDSGLGLRTMSSGDAGYSPLSYHCGTVWPHDTAIVVDGMRRAGLSEFSGGLVEGLLRASTAFDQRLPELWSGEGRPVPYPAACRPQAWSAAAAITVARAVTVET